MRVPFHAAIGVLGCLFLSSLAPANAQVGPPPLACPANVTAPNVKALPKPVPARPREPARQAVLREDFENIKVGQCAPAPVKPVSVVPSISTNKHAETRLSIVDRNPAPKYLDPLFARTEPGPEPDALLDFNPNREVIYFPAFHAAFKGRSLTFDFNSILDETFGDENVSPMFKRSTMAVVRRHDDLLFEVKVPIPFGR